VGRTSAGERPVKWARPSGTLSVSATAREAPARRFTGVHRCRVRHEEATPARGLGELPVPREITRIASEVFGGAELRG